MRGLPCADPAPAPLTGPLTAWGRLSCTQMCKRRGRIGQQIPALPSFHTFRAGTSWVNRLPEVRDPATCAGLTCANPAAPGNDRECHARGGGFLSLTWDTRVTMSACMHIDTRVGPLGLPARTGLLTAHAPTGQAPRWGLRYMRGVFAAACQATGAPSRSATTSS